MNRMSDERETKAEIIQNAVLELFKMIEILLSIALFDSILYYCLCMQSYV